MQRNSYNIYSYTQLISQLNYESLKKSFFTSLVVLPAISFASADNKFNTTILDHQQKAITDIQYDLSVSSRDKKDVGATTLRGDNLDGMEQIRKAFEKAPENSYLKTQLGISLAQLQIFNDKTHDAKKTLESLGSIQSNNNPTLQVLLTAYSLIWDSSSFEKNISVLKDSKWQDMPRYIHAIETSKSNLNLKINTDLNKLNLQQNSLAIVTLGYSLNNDGSMSDILIDRLKLTLAAHKKYPNAIIIVSGGVAHQGVTESYQMKQWLVKHGIAADKIIQEDQSVSTVTNATNSVNIIKQLNRPIKDILLISSDSHLRRANSIFQQEIQNSKLPIKVTNLGSITNYDLKAPANEHEKITVIRDTLRVAGIWRMPGMAF